MHNFDHLTDLVTKKLSLSGEPFTGTKEQIDWEAVKRVPQKLKQKAKLGSYTVDEEFDDLEKRLYVTDSRLKSISKYFRCYNDEVLQNVNISNDIAATTLALFDPTTNLPKEFRDKMSDRLEATKTKKVPLRLDDLTLSEQQKNQLSQEYRLWEDVTIYRGSLQDIPPAIESELRLMVSMVEGSVIEVLKLSENIKKHIKKRNFALLDHDKVYNQHDNLIFRQESGKELSLKQAQQIYHLERKLEQCKEHYNSINEPLKKELPYFFHLVDKFLEPMQIIVYYIQLMVSYQFSMHFMALKEPFNCPDDLPYREDFDAHIIKEYFDKSRFASEEIASLFITNFRKQYFDSLTSPSLNLSGSTLSSQSAELYCCVKFGFKKQQQGDLTIKSGDLIKVIDNSGNWWKGELNGEVGMFPGNYTEILPQDYNSSESGKSISRSRDGPSVR